MSQENDPQNAFLQHIKSLPVDQQDVLLNSVINWIQPKIDSAIEKLLPSAFDRLLEARGHSEESAGLVQLLAARSNDTKEQVLLKALTLYGLALDAKEKGQHLAIIDSDDVIVHDVFGVGTPEFALQKAH